MGPKSRARLRLEIGRGFRLVSEKTIGEEWPRNPSESLLHITEPTFARDTAMKCPKCGADNPDYAFYCGKCASELPRKPPTKTPGCPNCAKENPEGQRFCGNCGARLEPGPAIGQIERPKGQDWQPPSTWWGWLNQWYWYRLELPKKGLSFLGFTLYWILMSVIVSALILLSHGSIPAILVPFWVIILVVWGVLMYWVYVTNR